MGDDVNFEAVAKAIGEAGAPPEDAADSKQQGSESIPLCHTSGVTPKEWDRVKERLGSKS